jgi:hypothetical protein
LLWWWWWWWWSKLKYKIARTMIQILMCETPKPKPPRKI